MTDSETLLVSKIYIMCILLLFLYLLHYFSSFLSAEKGVFKWAKFVSYEFVFTPSCPEEFWQWLFKVPIELLPWGYAECKVTRVNS